MINWLTIAVPILVAVCIRILAKNLATWIVVSIIAVSYYPMLVVATTAFCGVKCEIDWNPSVFSVSVLIFFLLINPIFWVHLLLTVAIAFLNRPDPKARH